MLALRGARKDTMKSALKARLVERFYQTALFLRYGSNRTVRRYSKYRSRLPIAQKTVLFEAYHGARVSCVPYAIFKAMLADPQFSEYRFVWTFNPHDEGDNPIVAKYRSMPNVEFHPRHSKGYLKALASAKYLVNNKTFHHYFSKRPEQVHLTSWHATAFKTLGKDQYGSMGQYGNVARNYLQADYLVMPNRLTSDVLLDSCDVRSLFPGTVIEAGYPRSDLTLNTDTAQMKRFLVDLLGIDPTKRIVLYAPTWRGEVGAAIDTTDVIVDNITALAEGLPEGFQLLLKVHDRTYAFAKANPALQSLANVPDWFETNELLAAVDVLITDYSSICFDFLCLKRPIIHYVFDRAEYERTRGLYFDMETEMAGPLCYTAAEVNDAIARIDEVAQEYRERHEALIERLAYNEDGHASERVLDIVFRNQSMDYAYRTEDAHRVRVLVHPGALDADDAHLLDGLSALDFERFDVSLVFDGAPGKRDEYYLTKLDPRIKVFYFSQTPTRAFATRNVIRAVGSGSESRYLDAEFAQLYREELLGSVGFDVAIDLSGEASTWQQIFALTPYRAKVVFLANPFSGAQTTRSLAFLGAHFDTLVCTTRAEHEFYVNAAHDPAIAEKIVYLPVSERLEEFLGGVAEDVKHLLAGVEYNVDCSAEHLDPYCESSDLLFEFRVGGLDAANTRVPAAVTAALSALNTDTLDAIASSMGARECLSDSKGLSMLIDRALGAGER